MKHQWKTNSDGKVIAVDEDSEHRVAECLLCGERSGCLEAQDQGNHCYAIGTTPRLDADDCKGVDLTVTVAFTIRHPGAAKVDDDSSLVRQTELITLELVLDCLLDPVETSLAELVEAAAAQWRIVKAAHHEDWERAVAAARRGEVSQCP